MTDTAILTGNVIGDAGLTLEDLARLCAVSHEWVMYRVEEGLLPAHAAGAGDWRFSDREVRRVRCMFGIERDFEAAPELAALFADLVEELEGVRARLHTVGLD